MPVLQVELTETPYEGDSSTLRHKYLVKSTGMSDVAVYQFLQTEYATEFPSGLEVQRPTGEFVSSGYPILPTYEGAPIEELSYRGKRDSDPEVWEYEASYKFPGGGGGGTGGGLTSGETGSASITLAFEFAPRLARVTTSLETVLELPATGDDFAPNTSQAINVQPDGTVEGTDIPNGSAEISVSITQPSSWFTAAKVADLARKVSKGYVNNTAFTLGGLSFAAGEVRIQGMSGTINLTSGNSTFDVRFGILENASGLTVDGIDYGDVEGVAQTSFAVDGWDYVWVMYGLGSEDGKQSPKPRGLYVERLFPRTDLNALLS